ncbi:MAG: NAD(P)-binding domain-containing protein [Thermaerobacter sp.]|nr:NAD(P)-binding domain-containing protein [Thermaerobacter sp.]
MDKIAVIGTGAMGSRVAQVLSAGYEAFVRNRTRARRKALLALGAQAASSPPTRTAAMP